MLDRHADFFDVWERFITRFRKMEKVVILRSMMTYLVVRKILDGEELGALEIERARNLLPMLEGHNGPIQDLKERIWIVLDPHDAVRRMMTAGDNSCKANGKKRPRKCLFVRQPGL